MKSGTREYYEERILKVQFYIQDRLDESITLAELSKIACFSPYHFHRIFRGMVGESIKAYIRRLRLERAALQLVQTSKPVTEIAFLAGYETHESFTRAFGSMFNLPPQKYRELNGFGSVTTNTSNQKKYTLTFTRQEGEEMDVKIEKFKPITVAFVRHVGPYAECTKAWEQLCSDPEVTKTFASAPMFIGVCYDDPDVTEADKIRMDACVEMSNDFVPTNGISKQVIEGGEYAVLRHLGSYMNLHNSYKWLYGEWLPSSGREAKAAPSLEIYRNSPENTSEEELITDICIPLD